MSGERSEPAPYSGSTDTGSTGVVAAEGRAARLAVRLQPRAKRDEIVGERGGVLIVRVTAPPVEGRANDALCSLIARRARVGRTRVEVVRGSSSRDKVVRVEGVTTAELRRALVR